MLSFCQFGPRLLSARFKTIVGQHVTMVVLGDFNVELGRS
jgi:hypothetical protein